MKYFNEINPKIVLVFARFLTREQRENKGDKIVFSINGSWTTGYPYAKKKKKKNPTSHQFHPWWGNELRSHMMWGPAKERKTEKGKSIKLLEENICINLHDLG